MGRWGSLSSLEFFKWRSNIFIKKNLNKRLTWHPDENMELPGSFNFGIFSECNWSQKLLHLHILHPTISVPPVCIRNCLSWCLGQYKVTTSPSILCRVLWKKVYKSHRLESFNSMYLTKWNVNCTHLEKWKNTYMQQSHDPSSYYACCSHSINI